MTWKKRIIRWVVRVSLLILVILAGPIYLLATGDYMSKHWSSAETGSAGIAPHPSEVSEAVVQVYAARTWGARGAVAVHTWISVKPTNAPRYTVYQKIGWRLRYGNSAVSIREDIPDRHWYGNKPWLLADIRGEHVDAVIEKIHRAAMSYPAANEYRLWPGPNSNSFIAWILRRVPELRADLPPTAIGKDWLGAGKFWGPAPSGTGYQVTLFGAFGVTIGKKEGLEFNLGCAHIGIDPLGLALRLPGFGIVSKDGYHK